MNRNVVYIFICSTLVQTMHGSWLGSSTQHLTGTELALYRAIEAGNAEAASRELVKGAYPNAQLNGTTLFIHAFEHALNRDWQKGNQVVGVNEAHADVAYRLAQNGGNMQDIGRHIAEQYSNATAFKNNTAARMFYAFVNKLKTEARKY